MKTGGKAFTRYEFDWKNYTGARGLRKFCKDQYRRWFRRRGKRDLAALDAANWGVKA